MRFPFQLCTLSCLVIVAPLFFSFSQKTEHKLAGARGAFYFYFYVFSFFSFYILNVFVIHQEALVAMYEIGRNGNLYFFLERHSMGFKQL